MALLQQAAEAGLANDPEFRSAFGSYIEWGTRLAVGELPDRRRAARAHADAAPGPGHRRRAARIPGLRARPARARRRNRAGAGLPAAGEPARFGQHIKPLFRRHDRQSMSFAFDRRSHDDASQHAEAILGRLQAGTMPCDGPRPQEKTDVFARRGRRRQTGLSRA